MRAIRCITLLFIQLCIAESALDCATLFADQGANSDSAVTIECIGTLIEENNFVKAGYAVD